MYTCKTVSRLASKLSYLPLTTNSIAFDMFITSAFHNQRNEFDILIKHKLMDSSQLFFALQPPPQYLTHLLLIYLRANSWFVYNVANFSHP
jgi:hypothetical protein